MPLFFVWLVSIKDAAGIVQRETKKAQQAKEPAGCGGVWGKSFSWPFHYSTHDPKMQTFIRISIKIIFCEFFHF